MKAHRQNWEDLALLDPCWAILSTPDRQHHKWDLQEFFATGEAEAGRLMQLLDQLRRPVRRDRALDFGCGVGRLTRALSTRFGECIGVDISAEMVRRASELNRSVPGCRFLLNTDPDLRQFPARSFDLVYTNLVLQHLPGEALIRSYVGDFLRVTREDGLAVFQLPSHIPVRHRLKPRARLYGFLRRIGLDHETLYRTFRLNPVTMRFMPASRVRQFLASRNATLLHLIEARGHLKTNATYFVAP